MIEKFKRWLEERRSPEERPATRQPRAMKSQPHTLGRQFTQAKNDDRSGESVGTPQAPEDESLVRKKFLREDTGTHETFTILDDSLSDSGDETGIDPYNTGAFDRSKTWDRRFRK